MNETGKRIKTEKCERVKERQKEGKEKKESSINRFKKEANKKEIK